MKNKIKILAIGLIMGVLFLNSCTKGWEELNTDPNNPTTVPATNLLAQAIQYYGRTFTGSFFNMSNISTYAGHLGKIQYLDESRYFERESSINRAWRDLYRMGIDLKNAKKFADEEGNPNLKAAALTFQSYILAIGTDTWRNMPFTEGLSGDENLTNPKYDKQEDIYPALLDSLKKAGDIFKAGHLGNIGDGDLIFGGDKVKWQKFANSLRLRLANRIKAVAPSIANTHINEILGSPADYPIMTSNDDNAFINWTGSDPYIEPWAKDAETRDDHAMGSYLIDYMKSTNDPRLPVYAEPAATDGQFRGVVPGVSDANLGDINQYSRIGQRFRNNPTGFTPLMRYSELLFIVAEINNDATKYEEAIKASLEENGITDTTAQDAYVASVPFSMDNLYKQKWVALFKEGHEAWAETRRTDVPQMNAAPAARFPGHNRPPFRFAYPTSEANLNSANYTPNAANVVDRFWGEKMWWDTRSGVN